mgnify:CR=1 FL=1
MSSFSSDQRHARTSKLIAMILLLCIDLALNCTLDYDEYSSDSTAAEDWLEWDGGVPSALLALQAIIQVSIFLALFLAMADTFLFRVGLLGVLIRKFKVVIFLHPLYLACTLFTGVYRVQKLQSSASVATLWRDDTFIFLSIVQKMVAILYYLFNVRATVKLGDAKYFDKAAWMSLLRKPGA